MLFRRFAWSVLITAFLIGFVPARLSAQGGCTFTFSPASGSPSAGGGNYTVQITASSSSCVRPTPASNDPWITISFGGGTGNGSFGYTVLPNTSVVARSGSISHGNQTYIVNQAANTCSFSLSSNTSSFGGAGGNGSFSVIPSASECSWTATTSASWIRVNTAGGTGNGAVSFSVESNPTGVSRSGLIVAGGVTHTVNQTGSCVFTVTPTLIQAPAAGVQAGTIDINASLASCTWTVTSAPSWLTITYGDRGTGNGTAVGYSITANTTATERTDTLTVAGVPVTVTQAGQGACTIALSITEITATPYASTGSIAVTAASGCTWTSVSSATWLTVSSGASGNGTGTVNYSIAANTTGQSRFATLTIGGNVVPVTQPAQACSLVVYPFAFSVPVDGGSGTFNVTAASTCAWSPVSKNTDWIQVTSTGPGAGNGAASFVAFPNPSTSSRTGTITVGSQGVTVTQAGQTCSIRLTANGATSFAPAGGTGAFAISAHDDCAWTVTTNASWITITRGASGTGDDAGSYSVAANTGPTSRTGVILAGGSAIQVTQAGTVCTVVLAPASAGYPAAGGEGSIAVTSPCAWTATTPANWIVLTAPASGTGDGRLVYSVKQNTTTQSRSSSITIADATFPVTQSAGSCSYALFSNQRHDHAGGRRGLFQNRKFIRLPMDAGEQCELAKGRLLGGCLRQRNGELPG